MIYLLNGGVLVAIYTAPVMFCVVLWIGILDLASFVASKSSSS